MPVDPEALARELRFLRRGPGTRHPQVCDRIGPELAGLCGIDDAAGPAEVRHAMAETVKSVLRLEPRVTRLVLLAALALEPSVDQRFLKDREHWLTSALNLPERTVRRRVDEATDIFVRLAAERDADPADTAVADAWHVRAVDAVLLLDGARPELTERRTIVFDRNGVDEIMTRFTLPRAVPGTEAPRELTAKVIRGGGIRTCERLSEEHFRFVIELPRKFYRGESHEYVIRFSVPSGQPMAPHYVLQPLLRVRSLDLTVKFDPERTPSRIWKLDGVAPRMIEAPPPDGRDLLSVDRFGEINLAFQSLRQGFAYGVRWADS